MENIPESVVPSGPVSLARTQESHWGVSATSLPINTDVTVQIQTLISHTSFRIVIFFFYGLFFPLLRILSWITSSFSIFPIGRKQCKPRWKLPSYPLNEVIKQKGPAPWIHGQLRTSEGASAAGDSRFP